MKSKNYSYKGLKIGLIIGLVIFCFFVGNAYITQSSETFSLVFIFLPVYLIGFSISSMIVGALIGWIYGKIKNRNAQK